MSIALRAATSDDGSMKAPTLRFGPGGVSENAAKRDTLAGLERVRLVGLQCMELEFVRRVSMGEEKAALVKEAAKRLDVALSVHAPYYINLNSADAEILEASKRRLILAAAVGMKCGANVVAFHAGSYMGQASGKTFRKIKSSLRDVQKRCANEGIRVQLRPETSGRRSQFGTVDEILALSAELEDVFPCVDFAHLHSYEGKMNSYEEFASVLKTIQERLGQNAVADMHIHVSGIRFGAKGELEHVNLADSDLNYKALLKALKDFSAGGRIVCESPDREADALLLRRAYELL